MALGVLEDGGGVEIWFKAKVATPEGDVTKAGGDTVEGGNLGGDFRRGVGRGNVGDVGKVGESFGGFRSGGEFRGGGVKHRWKKRGIKLGRDDRESEGCRRGECGVGRRCVGDGGRGERRGKRRRGRGGWI